ncbi:MAG TPA: glycosyltransferase family 1 protein [Candidatus Acidoferrales bacterium]|nr:glycosyltransferase family 1 protein [Candidatus Acidoferrales bacterium]
MIYADQRWIGEHGIGRVARTILAELVYRPVNLRTNPAAPLDALRLAVALRGLTQKDVFFSPGYNCPLFCTAPYVFTIHDLNHIDRPENSTPLKSIYYATILKRACHRAAHILTVSEFSRHRIIDWAGVQPDKVVNIGGGVSSQFSPDVAPYELPYPYLLCVSNRKGHKNELQTLQSFARAKLDPAVTLVFTGEPTEALVSAMGRFQISHRVHFVGRITDKDLPSLYRGAQALVFVSLYEGFGLPVLEAMACGTPVVTSKSSALPEVAGDAALLVDPESPEEIAEALERVMLDESLRGVLRERGISRAHQFSWSTTITRVREVLSWF